MISKGLRLFHTIRFLRLKQMLYRGYYFLRNRILPNKIIRQHYLQHKHFNRFNWHQYIVNYSSFQAKATFTFLNQSHAFSKKINWNYSHFGKLWTYNLNYFEWLSQKGLNQTDGLAHIHSFIEKIEDIKDGLEPFPTSLRIINWIKFLLTYKIEDATILSSIYHQLKHLERNLEYHLLGNHLLENAFALVFGGVYFDDQFISRKGFLILEAELEEQILADGAHFELSPMYHQLMLYRLLDVIQLLQNAKHPKRNEFLPIASKMLGWLNQITFKSGHIPRVNDTTCNIAPSTKALNEYATQLNISPNPLPLSTSGYRMIKREGYEMLIDGGQIGPSYIPGHAHADITNFILYVAGKPFIVDPGISTYEKNERRQLERSTSAHNVVQVGNDEQSEVWGGFRVARRSKGVIVNETDDSCTIEIQSYSKYYNKNKRRFNFNATNVVIVDEINRGLPAVARLHFHPDVSVSLNNGELSIESVRIEFIGVDSLVLEDYEYPLGYNLRKVGKCATIQFINRLETLLVL